jgi:hypothetical protein
VESQSDLGNREQVDQPLTDIEEIITVERAYSRKDAISTAAARIFRILKSQQKSENAGSSFVAQ